jgi:hypothetical protein
LEFPSSEANLMAQIFIACAREVIKSIPDKGKTAFKDPFIKY